MIILPERINTKTAYTLVTAQLPHAEAILERIGCVQFQKDQAKIGMWVTRLLPKTRIIDELRADKSRIWRHQAEHETFTSPISEAF